MAKKTASKLRVPNLVVVSDLHVVSHLGLCTAAPFVMDEGGEYHASALQRKVWAWWEEFWGEWVPLVCRGEPFAVALNGDAVDGGAHHGNTNHITADLGDQQKLAVAILKPVVEACEGRYYHIRGTEAHAGQSGVDEERLASALGAVPDPDGRRARWELWIRVGRGLVHLTHHIGTAGSLAYETTAIHKELEQAFVEAARWSDEPPDVVVRSHRHRNAETRIQTSKGFATSCTTAGWQLKTPLAHRIAGARQTQPQIGGSLVRCGDEDIYTRHRLWKLDRPTVEEL